MRYGQLYQHYKQKEYFFCGIALPIREYTGSDMDLALANLAYDAHTPEDEEEIGRLQLYVHEGAYYIDRDVYHVIYQSKDDYETDKVWVREVEEFFGMVDLPTGNKVKRFTQLDK